MTYRDRDNPLDRDPPDAPRGTDLRSLAVLDALGMLDEVDAAQFDRAFRESSAALQSELRALQAAVAADPAFLAVEEPAVDLKVRTLARVMTAVDRQEESLAPIAHIGRTASHAGRRPVRSIDATELVEQAMELAALRKDVERFARSSSAWRAAAIATIAALTVALVFQVTTSSFAMRISEFALGVASTQQIFDALDHPGAMSRLEHASVRRSASSLPGVSEGAVVLAVDDASGKVMAVAIGVTAGKEYVVRHVLENGPPVEIGRFTPQRGAWSAEFSIAAADAVRLSFGTIEVLDSTGAVVMRG